MMQVVSAKSLSWNHYSNRSLTVAAQNRVLAQNRVPAQNWAPAQNRAPSRDREGAVFSGSGLRERAR